VLTPPGTNPRWDCALGLIRTREIGFFDTVGHEFIVALGEQRAGQYFKNGVSCQGIGRILRRGRLLLLRILSRSETDFLFLAANRTTTGRRYAISGIL
jgi:hypothetical protein